MCQISITVLIPMSVVSMALGLALLIAGIVAGALKVPDDCKQIESTYNTGYYDVYNSGYDNGYNVGFNLGFNSGYNYGYNSGYNYGYYGYNAGFDAGTYYNLAPSASYANTYPSEYTGYSSSNYYRAYQSGYNSGYNAGYSGFNAGYNTGYNTGYNQGHDSFQNGVNFNTGYSSGSYRSTAYKSEYSLEYKARYQSVEYSPLTARQEDYYPFSDCNAASSSARGSVLSASLLGCVPAFFYIVSGALGIAAGIYRSKIVGGFYLALLIVALICSLLALLLLPFISLAGLYFCGYTAFNGSTFCDAFIRVFWTIEILNGCLFFYEFALSIITCVLCCRPNEWGQDNTAVDLLPIASMTSDVVHQQPANAHQERTRVAGPTHGKTEAARLQRAAEGHVLRM
ncbi:hypothetical protein GUITHDRAFT_139144 [Guillardia theta CCMP2712]|uniref:Uncharacterized protein n=1 Tax=Guillardia theta (strain CCMP2712) TaxID=905079 RepID=L1J9L7_GUITC|nr:hypothetical protein GUITHDRAFT_139144 [Guillardia theta CCMP2712]EKX45226.1 hypothetical protein GUITHDRAFT_139144 [Guillardia theta CCMP2712]|eukprot:XP_005832206.1 hypothetical protein GUITHDRAFT_139144 [Guillardia theta CCMP2712]